MVYAKTDPAAGSRITAFIIEKDMPVSANGSLLTSWACGAQTGRAGFQDCKCPSTIFWRRTGCEGPDVRAGLRARCVFGFTGIMAAYIDEIMPISSNASSSANRCSSSCRVRCGHAQAELGPRLRLQVARACDRGEVTRQDAAACVLYSSEEAMVVAHQAVQAMGGAGFMNDTPVSRLFRDAKLMEIGAGTSEIRRDDRRN